MRSFVRILVLFLLLLASYSPAIFAQKSPAAWNPRRTWVFMVGMLERKDSESFASFPKKNRRDEVLMSVLKKSGVPAEQTFHLQDSRATTARIRSEFVNFLGRTRPGDTLFVYYEGHGYKTDDGKTYLASYDVDEARNPGWPVASVPDTIEHYFRGDKAILVLDNCYSGSMAKAVNNGKRRVSYAVMASSSASQSSTGNWTFKEAIISAFRGSPFADDNRDGIITFAELQANAEADMLFGEEQVATFALTGSFDPESRITDVTRARSSRIGDRVEAYSVKNGYWGYIIDAKDGKFLIHYYGFEVSDDEWVTPKMIRVPVVNSAYKVGEGVEVE
jgi:hypothetical protein